MPARWFYGGTAVEPYLLCRFLGSFGFVLDRRPATGRCLFHEPVAEREGAGPRSFPIVLSRPPEPGGLVPGAVVDQNVFVYLVKRIGMDADQVRRRWNEIVEDVATAIEQDRLSDDGCARDCPLRSRPQAD